MASDLRLIGLAVPVAQWLVLQPHTTSREAGQAGPLPHAYCPPEGSWGSLMHVCTELRALHWKREYIISRLFHTFLCA